MSPNLDSKSAEEFMFHVNRFKIACIGAIVFLMVSFQTAMGQQLIGWADRADSMRGRNGLQVAFTCPANGSLSHAIWGTDLYTDDSSICVAAVHAGLISARNGGVVTIEIRAGASSYTSSGRNGVTSKSYGGWSGSFVFLRGTGGGGGGGNTMMATWATQADFLRGQNGQKFTLTCPPNGSLGRLWGTDLYTDDSSICTAAVHAGLIGTANGGSVSIEIRPGASSYKGSSRNGVTSIGYGGYSGSFVFVGGQGNGGGGNSAINATWATQADSLRGRNGQRFTFTCPANGVVSSRLGGSGTYTDDSSICTAAVHAGLISARGGGTVTIEIMPGASSYQGSKRNGVTSSGYGGWGGSFRFVQ
jgi:hypothetical protein